MLERKKTLENDFVERLERSLHESFKNTPVNFKVDYFLAGDQKERFLCINIESSVGGIVYKKAKELKPHEFISEAEDGFMQEVMTDLIINGVAFLNLETVRSKQNTPRLLKTININLN